VEKLTSLSVFFPAYNDGGTIASMVAAAHVACSQVTDTFEIIVVNDGSSDYTAQVLTELQNRYLELSVVTHPINLGYGGALRSGVSAAKNDWVFYTDGDAQYNPLELTCLVAALAPGVDVVNGYKTARGDGWMRGMVGWSYNRFVQLLFGIRLRDVDCDFRLISRRIFDEIELFSNSGAICLEMVKKIEDGGYRFAEVAVSHFPRSYGVSQFFVPRRILQSLLQLTELYWKLVVKKEHLHKKT
jgi:glycosyltransferase involved in cell wall biosynthesis